MLPINEFRQADRGFSLIEILLALVILSVALTAIYQVSSGGLRSAASGEKYTRAVLVAQSQLVTAGVDSPSIASSGQTDGFSWQTSFAPFRVNASTEKSNQALRLFEVKVDVSWDETGSRQTVSLRTLKLLNTP